MSKSLLSRSTLAVLPLVVVPSALLAQIGVSLPRPTVRGDIGPWSIGASIGRGGVDVSVGARRTTTATTPRAPRPRTTPTGTSTARTTTAASVLSTARRYLGTRYVWGGTTPRGFDCSGFVQYVFRRHGVRLPRTSRQQAHAGLRVARGLRTLRPGDLMLFATRGSRIDHVAIYAGRNRIIHSSSSGGGVVYDDLSTRRGRYFVSRHVATRRVVSDGRRLVRDLEASLASLDGAPIVLDPPDLAPRR